MQDPAEVGLVGVIDAQLEALAASQYGVIATWQLGRLGVGSRALAARNRDGRLRRLYRGVYATGPYLSTRGQWMAATLAGGPAAMLSHRAAGSLHDLIAWGRGPIDVTVTGGRGRRRPGLRSHQARLRDRDRAVVDGIPATSVARTLLDLAAALTPTRLRRAYEAAERAGALDLAGIAELLDRSNGHRGVRPLRALLAYDPTAAAGALSELERIFLDLLRRHGIPMPLTNVLVGGFLVDAHWPEANLVVELDGYEFHRDRDAFEADRRKLAQLRLGGREAIALTYRQVVDDPEWVVATVITLLTRGRPARARAV